MVFDMSFGAFSLGFAASGTVAALKISIGFDGVMAYLLLAAASVLILKSFGFKGAPLVTVVALVSLVTYYSEALSSVSVLFGELSSTAEAGKYVSAALKVVGISYLSGISMDACRQMGEDGIAKTVSVVTKLELMLLAVPFIKEILSAVLLLLSS